VSVVSTWEIMAGRVMPLQRPRRAWTPNPRAC